MQYGIERIGFAHMYLTCSALAIEPAVAKMEDAVEDLIVVGDGDNGRILLHGDLADQVHEIVLDIDDEECADPQTGAVC